MKDFRFYVFVLLSCLIYPSCLAQDWGGCDYYKDCQCIVGITSSGILMNARVTNQTEKTPYGTDSVVSLMKEWGKIQPFSSGEYKDIVAFARREPDLSFTNCAPPRFYSSARRISDNTTVIIEFTDTRNTTNGPAQRISHRIFEINFNLNGTLLDKSIVTIRGLAIVRSFARIFITYGTPTLHIGEFDLDSISVVEVIPILAYNGANQLVELDVASLGVLYHDDAPNFEYVTFDRKTSQAYNVLKEDTTLVLRYKAMSVEVPGLVKPTLTAFFDNNVTARASGAFNEYVFTVALAGEDATISVLDINTLVVGADFQCFYRNLNLPDPQCPDIMPEDPVIPETSDNPQAVVPPKKKSDNSNAGIIGGVVGGVGAALLIGGLIGFLLFKRKKDRREKTSQIDLESPEKSSRDRSKSSAELINFGTIKDVEIINLIGTGQFGEVYKGTWQGTTDCAIKKLKKSEGFEDFITEAKILKNLTHPNVVRFFGIFTDPDGNMNLVTEFMSHGSLLGLLQSEGRNLKIEDLLQLAKDSAAGMKYLESKNIIHRDLAARNLLVKQEDGRLVVKVADFGLSRASENSYYGGGASVFPIKWSPPEVINYRKFSPKSDVWSFGVVLWEITEYGKIPYPTKSNDETAAAVSEGYRLPKPNSCPDSIYEIMLECWAESPDKRPTFENLYKRISTILSDEYKVQNVSDSTKSAKIKEIDDNEDDSSPYQNTNEPKELKPSFASMTIYDNTILNNSTNDNDKQQDDLYQ